ncbi:MAG: hypothetical protein ACXAC8_17705 [Candidatus Hodarchaeales archaeon]|jgi:hypothetical protein
MTKKKYKKTHTNPKAANSHKKRIKARGGSVKQTKKGDKITLEYNF